MLATYNRFQLSVVCARLKPLPHLCLAIIEYTPARKSLFRKTERVLRNARAGSIHDCEKHSFYRASSRNGPAADGRKATVSLFWDERRGKHGP